ncbi:MAG: T9SS type A sorting domain-containing protein [Flavobacteriales bacterium]
MKNLFSILIISLLPTSLNAQSVDFQQFNLATFTDSVSAIRAADIDGDGDVDILSIRNNKTLQILENTGDLHYKISLEMPFSSSGRYLKLLDYDEDGKLDFLFRQNQELVFYRQTDDFQFEQENFPLSWVKSLMVLGNNSNSTHYYTIQDSVLYDLTDANAIDTLARVVDPNHNLSYKLKLELDQNDELVIYSLSTENYPPSQNDIPLLLKTIDPITGNSDTLFYFVPEEPDYIPFYNSSFNLLDVDNNGERDLLINKSGDGLYVFFVENQIINPESSKLPINPIFMADVTGDGKINFGKSWNDYRSMYLSYYTFNDTVFEVQKIDGRNSLAGEAYSYSAVTVSDIDQDGIKDIVYATGDRNVIGRGGKHAIWYRTEEAKTLISYNEALNSYFHVGNNQFLINRNGLRYENLKGNLIHIDSLGGVAYKSSKPFTWNFYDHKEGEIEFHLRSKQIKANPDAEQSYILMSKNFGDIFRVLSFDETNTLYEDSVCTSKFKNLGVFSAYGDYNFDNKIDVVASRNNELFMALNTACEDAFIFETIYTFNAVSSFKIQQPKPFKRNHDQYHDFIVQRNDTNLIHLISYANGSYFLDQSLEGNLISIKDINQDGLDDILTSNYLYINTLNDFIQIDYPNPDETFFKAINANNEGFLEILMTDSTNQLKMYSSFPSDYFSSSELIHQFSNPISSSPIRDYFYQRIHDVPDFDFNEDGKEDFLVFEKGHKTYLFIDKKAKLISGGSKGENPELDFDFYPNPNTGILYFSNAFEVERVVVSDVLGRHVKTFETNGGNTINISNLPAAPYIMTFDLKNQSNETHQIIKL